jgi:cysteine desulfurase
MGSTARPLRDALEEDILSSIPDTELNGHKTQRLANTTNITFHGIESEALLSCLTRKASAHRPARRASPILTSPRT